MSISTALQVPKTVDVDGNAVEFPLIDIYDLGTIDQARKDNLKKLAKSNAKETNLPSGDLFNVLTDIDARDCNINELLAYGVTAKGAVDLLTRSLGKRGVDPVAAKKIISSMTSNDAAVLAYELMWVREKKKDAESPNEQAAMETTNTPAATVKTETTSNAASSSSTSTPTNKQEKPVEPKVPLAFGD